MSSLTPIRGLYPPMASSLETSAVIIASACSITLASYRSLQSYLAAASLTRPPPPPLASKPKPAIPKPTLSRRLRTLAHTIAPILVGWCLPRYGSQPMVNIFSLVLAFSFLQDAFYLAILRAPPPSSITLHLEYGAADDPSSKLVLRSLRSDRTLSVSRMASCGLAAAFLVLAYLDVLPLPLLRAGLPPLFVFYILLFMFIPRISVRHATYVIVGGVVIPSVLVAVVILILRLLISNESSSSSVERITYPSDWICDILTAAGPSGFIAYASAITPLTFRYEYVRTHGLPPRLGPGEKCPVPISVKPFRPVLSAVSLLLFLAIESILPLVARFVPSTTIQEMLQAGMGVHLFFLVPVVFGLIAFAAWMRGELKAWWNYTETWVPKTEVVDRPAGLDDDEKTVHGDESVVDEKTIHVSVVDEFVHDEKTTLGQPTAAQS